MSVSLCSHMQNQFHTIGVYIHIKMRLLDLNNVTAFMQYPTVYGYKVGGKDRV